MGKHQSQQREREKEKEKENEKEKGKEEEEEDGKMESGDITTSKLGFTPLHLAVQANNLEMAKLLLKYIPTMVDVKQKDGISCSSFFFFFFSFKHDNM